MKKRMEQLLNSKFEYEADSLILSEERIFLEAGEGEVLQGSFTLSHPRERKVKGFLYSSNPRMTFEPEDFYSSENKIFYQMDTNGLKPGEETGGQFTICTDLGEYALPYTVGIRKRLEEEKQGEVLGLKELETLARTDFQAAYPVFISPGFEKMLQEKEPNRYLLYEALKRQTFSYQSLEEFLIGCGEKEPVELTLEKEEVRFLQPEQSFRENVKIRKDGWGFLRLNLSSDTRFLRLEKKVITTDEFVGNQYQLEYIVDTNFLHAGKNYGRIKVSTCYQTLTFEVTVVKSQDTEAHRLHRVRKNMQKKLEMLYVDFRLKRIDLQSWIDRSQNVINSYKRAGGEDVYADLFLVQLLFADEKRAKAYKILQEIEQQPQRLSSPDRYAFYLYISTFFQRDISYVDQVEARIEQLFLQNRDNWILQWILLYLQERLMRDDSAKLEVLTDQIRYGCSSPILYLEAWQLLEKDPFLLRRLDEIERKILWFGAKRNLLTEELAHQVGSLAMYHRTFQPRLLEILKSCYQVNHSPEIVKAICTVLIAGEKKEQEYFPWYALGVKMDLRITGLYEYYMETMDQCGVEKMPQIIRRYFVYNNTLDYHKKAGIYRSMSDNRDNIPQIYRSYRAALESFLVEQLGMERIDENLAVLYERCLTRQMLTRTLAERLVRLLFTFEVTCKNPNMKSIVVTHRIMKGEQTVPFVNGRAQVPIYTEDARILLMDGQGNRYASTSLYLAERVLDTPRLLEYCLELVPDHPGLVLYMCSMKKEGETITRQVLPFLKRACEMDGFREEYRAQVRGWILDYYMEHPREEELFAYLKQISYPDFLRADKRALMSLLTQEGMYEEAFALLETYGCEEIPLVHLVRICSQTILAREYEENMLLLSYCSQCFAFGKYDDNILTYLLMYYDGPVEEMKRLWNIGRQYEMDTMLLEEKILSLLLFTRSGTSGTEQIFASYHRKLGRRKICTAYIILKAYEYFVKGLPVHDLLFEHIENGYQNGAEQEEVCLLALMQHYSCQLKLTEVQESIVSSLLARYCGQGLRFAFYQKFPEKLRQPYQLEDKVFLEYAANPQNKVILHYRIDTREEEFKEEPMKDCFEGIFVKEFILFFGEEMECYTEEILPDQTVKLSDRRILSLGKTPGNSNNRFDILNRICQAQQNGREEKVKEELENYFLMEYLTKEVFTLI